MGLPGGKTDDKTCMRTMECNLGLLKRTDGSAVFVQGKTEVVTAVYGPAEVKQNKELMDKATVECTMKPKSGIPGCQEKILERIIRNTADTVIISHLHPRSSISIICQVIQDGGSLLSCSLNSVCMACINAGVPMDCMFAAVCCSISEDEGIVLDPDSETEENSKALVTAVFESKSKKLVTCETKGILSVEEYFSCIDSCRAASERIFTFQRECVKRFLSKEIKEEPDERMDHFQ